MDNVKNILFVVGSDLSTNSSANLCHNAYINGFVENGCKVDVVTVCSEDGVRVERDSQLRYFGYKSDSLYEKIGHMFSNQGTPADGLKVSAVEATPNAKVGFIRRLKNFIISLYGPHETYISWKRRAIKFKSDVEYDLMISLSFPPVGHLIAYELKKRGRIKAKKWIQIWEDPWSRDLIFLALRTDKKVRRKTEKEEARLLGLAENVLYVSPITLEIQKSIFSDSASKMNWEPVPSYYSTNDEIVPVGKTVFGYFGDYTSTVRNLAPFYEAAKNVSAHVRICGSSDDVFATVDNIIVRPRLNLSELKPIEDEANVLVFVCNLRGGQIPGKIYQYSATHKTILFILDGTEEEVKIIKSYFEKFNRYVFCNNNVEDISRAMQDIQHGNVNVINKPIEYFTPSSVAKRLLEVAK